MLTCTRITRKEPDTTEKQKRCHLWRFVESVYKQHRYMNGMGRIGYRKKQKIREIRLVRAIRVQRKSVKETTMFKPLPPKPDFPALERETLQWWKETDAFNKLRQLRQGGPTYSFLDGPITAN